MHKIKCIVRSKGPSKLARLRLKQPDCFPIVLRHLGLLLPHGVTPLFAGPFRHQGFLDIFEAHRTIGQHLLQFGVVGLSIESNLPALVSEFFDLVQEILVQLLDLRVAFVDLRHQHPVFDYVFGEVAQPVLLLVLFVRQELALQVVVPTQLLHVFRFANMLAVVEANDQKIKGGDYVVLASCLEEVHLVVASAHDVAFECLVHSTIANVSTLVVHKRRSKSEVDESHSAIFPIYHHVLRFEVVVDELRTVHQFQYTDELYYDPDHFLSLLQARRFFQKDLQSDV